MITHKYSSIKEVIIYVNVHESQKADIFLLKEKPIFKEPCPNMEPKLWGLKSSACPCSDVLSLCHQVGTSACCHDKVGGHGAGSKAQVLGRALTVDGYSDQLCLLGVCWPPCQALATLLRVSHSLPGPCELARDSRSPASNAINLVSLRALVILCQPAWHQLWWRRT